MPKVFTSAELRERKIPSLDAFSTIAEKARERLEGQSGFLGGLIYGSFTHGAHTIQSDLDLFVLTERINEEEVIAALQKIQMAAAKENVPLEIVAIDRETAESPGNYIGPAFAYHLVRAAEKGAIIKANPFKRMTFYPKSQMDDAREYFENRFRMIRKNWVRLGILSDEELAAYLQNLLQLPMHVARNMLFHCNCRLENDSSQKVMKEYFDITSRQAQQLFFQLVIAGTHYTNALQAELKNGFDEKSYRETLRELAEKTPVFLEFLRVNFAIIEAKYNF